MPPGDRPGVDESPSPLDQFTELFVVLDDEWRIVRLNRAARAYLNRLGLDPDALPGRVIWNEVPELVGTPLFRAAVQAVREQRPVEVEAFFPPRERWFAARFLPGAPGLRCFLRDSTAERAAQQAARSSASLVQTVINGTDDVIYAKDLAGRYVMVNRAMIAMLGQDITGKTDRDVFPEPFWKQFVENDRAVLDRCETLVFEESWAPPGGEALLFESSKSVLRDAAGQAAGVLGISRNITQARRDRRRRELLYEAGARLTASLDLEATFDAITSLVVPDFADICMVDVLAPTGTVQRVRVSISDRVGERRLATQLLRLAPDYEWDEHPIAAALRTAAPVALYDIAPATLERFAQDKAHRQILHDADFRSLIAVPFIAHQQTLGGLTVAYSESGRHYAPEDVPLLQSLADRMALAIANARLFRTVQDELAQRSEAQAELTRWGKIFEHAGWGVAIGDPETGRYLQVNTTYARLHGYEPEELTGTPIWTLTAPDLRQFARDEAQLALETGRVAYASRHLRRDGSEFPVRLDLSAVSDGRSRMIVANLQDDSERQQVEERVREAQKMDALGRLAGGVAHDFNNMLMIIMGFADFLVAALDESDVRRKDAVEIRKASEKAAALTQQLLVFGRRMPVRASTINLNEVVTSLGDMLRSVLGENVVLHMTLNPDPGGVRVDRGQLEQALLNLTLNAKDAMPGGGRLTVATSTLSVTGHVLSGGETDVPPGEYEIVEVSDTGHGMDEATRARIFEPFFTTRAGSRNSGLGLSVVYGMVTQNNGYVWVTSTPGVGSRFTLGFPRTALPAVEPVASHGAAPPGHEAVLVVEDERAVRLLVRRALAEAGYRVMVASDADQALEILARPEPVHLLLSDLVLPGMPGTELVARAAREHPGLAVVLMSGHAGPRSETTAGELLLTKPFAPSDLIRRVREALDGKAGRREDGMTG